MKKLHYVGLDVHARTIAVALADEGGVRSIRTIDHDVPTLLRVLAKIGPPGSMAIVYEAGPTGYGLCRALRGGGYETNVVAPSLIPSMPGDRVKTDRRDAEKLAMLAQANLLSFVAVPDQAQEAVRDLVRAREAAKAWEKKAGQQLDKFLLRYGRRPAERMTKWTQKHMDWVRAQEFEQPAQRTAFDEYLAEYVHQRQRVKRLDGHLNSASEQLAPVQQAVVQALVALKGVRFLTAITIVSEIGDMMRFAHPTLLMAYAGVVPREHSSGDSVRRGTITKTGNAHLRRIVGEAAWSYARGKTSTPSRDVLKRRTDLSAGIVAIAQTADHRLHKRYRALTGRGKHKNKVITAVARELLGFVWAIGVKAQQEHARARKDVAA